jgi:hypothetical protein
VCDNPQQQETERLKFLLSSATIYSADHKVALCWKVLRPAKQYVRRVKGYLFVPVYHDSTIKVLPYLGITLTALARLFPSKKIPSGKRGKTVFRDVYPEWISSALNGPDVSSNSEESKLWKAMQKMQVRIASSEAVSDTHEVSCPQRHPLAILCKVQKFLISIPDRYIIRMHQLWRARFLPTEVGQCGFSR